ncbi:MAG: hypothetical protein ACP5DZ_11370, partial [Bacteroidales bacterium]
ILGKMTDGVVMVSRPGVADSESAKLSKELLEQSKQTVLGLVVNGSAAKSLPYRYSRVVEARKTPV